jgi:hypothetical protein
MSILASSASVHGPPWFHFETKLQLRNLDFDADPDLAVHSVVDPDPAFQNDAYPCGSVSATMQGTFLPSLFSAADSFFSYYF